MLQIIFLDVIGKVVHLKKGKYTNVYIDALAKTSKKENIPVTWTELVMVLRANTVAESLMVDWLSNAP